VPQHQQWLAALPINETARALLMKEEVTEESLVLLEESDLKEMGLATDACKALANEIAKRNGRATPASGAYPQWMEALPIKDNVRAILMKEEIDEESFLLLEEADFEAMGVATGPRKLLVRDIALRNAKGEE